MAIPLQVGYGSFYCFEEEMPFKYPSFNGNAYMAFKKMPALKNIVISKLRALWQSSCEKFDPATSKNHMSFRLEFDQEIQIFNTSYYAALLAVEVDYYANPDRNFKGVFVSRSILKCGQHFVPGVFCLKLLSYKEETKSAAFMRQYPILQGATLGQFIDAVLEAKLHRFVFNYYPLELSDGTKEVHAKGCGHFALRAFKVWNRKGLVTSYRSIEPPYRPFPEDIMYTYLPDGSHIYARIGRGHFLELKDETSDEDDEDVPFTTWSTAVTELHRRFAKIGDPSALV